MHVHKCMYSTAQYTLHTWSLSGTLHTHSHAHTPYTRGHSLTPWTPACTHMYVFYYTYTRYKEKKRLNTHITHKSIWINKSSVNLKSTSNQSSKPCTVLQYPSRTMSLWRRSRRATLLHAWHDSFMCVTRPFHMYDTHTRTHTHTSAHTQTQTHNHIYTHTSIAQVILAEIEVRDTYDMTIHVCDITYSYVWHGHTQPPPKHTSIAQVVMTEIEARNIFIFGQHHWSNFLNSQYYCHFQQTWQ